LHVLLRDRLSILNWSALLLHVALLHITLRRLLHIALRSLLHISLRSLLYIALRSTLDVLRLALKGHRGLLVRGRIQLEFSVHLTQNAAATEIDAAEHPAARRITAWLRVHGDAMSGHGLPYQVRDETR
jgi:hypothetical protein